jgi:hypothetical protein
VTVSNSTLTGNSTAGESAKGGAISSEFGAVTVSNSTLTGNSTAGEIAAGGAIQTVYGALTVIDSTLWRNFTTGPAANGGAVQSDQGAVTVINSTLTGNSTANGNGGAIDTGGPGVVTATVTNSTVAFNRAPNGLGGGICSQSVPVILNNSIVARNSDNGTAPDLLPTTDPVNDPLTVRYSLIGNNTGTGLAEAQPPNPGINGNFIGSAANPIDPLLGPLTNNGGPTLTHALLAGSPALNRGNNGLAFDPQTLLPLVNDQRGPGFARRLGSVDMGAFEMQSSPLGGQMPPPPLGGQARGIIAALVSKKVKKSRRLFVRVSFADTGALKSEVRSPFNRPAFRRIVVSVFDSNGDGLADTVRLTARKGKKTLTRLLAL